MTKLISILLVLMTATIFYLSYQKIQADRKFIELTKETHTDSDCCSVYNPEYQFIVVDDSIIVYDGNREVGTVKLQGQLDSLIVDDNE